MTSDKEQATEGDDAPTDDEAAAEVGAIDELPDLDENASPEATSDDPATDTTPESEPDVEPIDEPEPAPTGQRSFAGLVALVVSVVALAGVAFLYVTRESLPELDFAAPADVAAVRQELNELRTSVAALESGVESVEGIGDESADSRERLAASLRAEIRALEERLGTYDSLSPRVGNLENAVASIQGIEAGARDTLLLAEAEYYLQTANTLLTLAGNVELATVALEMADDRLVGVGNPALNNVRQAVRDELTALEGTPRIDIESNVIVLASLARLADSLPLKPIESGAAETPAESAEEPGAAGRTWNAIKEAMGDIVKVTPPGEDTAPLLIPGTEPLIRSNLALQLQAARLALLTREQAVFEQSLDDADEWLALYFDDASLQVTNARETIAEIRGIELTSELPDISESLRLLRRYQSLSGSGP